MITEDYCSYEVAKLLKEKGFDERSYGSYTEDSVFQEGYGKWNSTPIYIAAPTLQMAMRWLREEKNIFIDVYYEEDIKGYMYSIIKLTKGTILNVSDLADNSYEEAVEAALKYSLENLI